MARAWRIVKAKHQNTAFDGEGAGRYSGRWNSKGILAVYTASSVSLATLEMLVHLHPSELNFSYVVIGVEIPDALIVTLNVQSLPSDWNSYPERKLQKIGDAWLLGLSSVAWKVPSAIIPSESNFILNPKHPDFSRIAIGPAMPYGFDPRLVKKA